MKRPATDNAGVIAPPPLLFLVTALAGGAAHFLFPIDLSPHLALRIAGAGLALTAGGLATRAWIQMATAGTNVRPDKPTTAIVASGPYRFTRNPMYVSLCLLNLGIGLLWCDLVPIALTLPFAVVLQAGVIAREERYLEAKFGEAYTAYRRRVRRWL
jgi:protein-S-isoprenylcysteine O-methyltransferase Ste14